MRRTEVQKSWRFNDLQRGDTPKSNLGCRQGLLLGLGLEESILALLGPLHSRRLEVDRNSQQIIMGTNIFS